MIINFDINRQEQDLISASIGLLQQNTAPRVIKIHLATCKKIGANKTLDPVKNNWRILCELRVHSYEQTYVCIYYIFYIIPPHLHTYKDRHTGDTHTHTHTVMRSKSSKSLFLTRGQGRRCLCISKAKKIESKRWNE
jgi:hypothetical protein